MTKTSVQTQGVTRQPHEIAQEYEAYIEREDEIVEAVAATLHEAFSEHPSSRLPLNWSRLSKSDQEMFQNAARMAVRLLNKGWRDVAETRATKTMLDELRILGLTPHRSRNGQIRELASQVRRHRVNTRSVLIAWRGLMTGDIPPTLAESTAFVNANIGADANDWMRVSDPAGSFFVCSVCWPDQLERYTDYPVSRFKGDDLSPYVHCQCCEYRVDGSRLPEVG